MAKEEKDPKGLAEEVQRWTAKRRAALVTSLIRGETWPVNLASSEVFRCRRSSDPWRW